MNKRTIFQLSRREGSLLDAADDDARLEVLLHKGIEDDERKRADHHHHHPQGSEVEGDGISRRGEHALCAVVDEDIAHDELQRIEILVRAADEHRSIHPRIPMADGIEEHHRGDEGGRQREHDLHEDAYMARAVDLRRLADGIIH